MKGRFWRKAVAACLALLLVTGNVPIQPVADLFGNMAITANAETSTINVDGTDYTLFTSFTATGGSTGMGVFTYDKAVDGLTELYKSGEKVSFKWFGGNLYCCPENVASYPIECAVFHKPSYVYLYDAEYGAPIHRNNAE